MPRRRFLIALSAGAGALGVVSLGTLLGGKHLLERQAAIARQIIGNPLGRRGAAGADKT